MLCDLIVTFFPPSLFFSRRLFRRSVAKARVQSVKGFVAASAGKKAVAKVHKKSPLTLDDRTFVCGKGDDISFYCRLASAKPSAFGTPASLTRTATSTTPKPRRGPGTGEASASRVGASCSSHGPERPNEQNQLFCLTPYRIMVMMIRSTRSSVRFGLCLIVHLVYLWSPNDRWLIPLERCSHSLSVCQHCG